MFERPLGGRTLSEGIRPRLVKTLGDELFLQSTIRCSGDAREVVRSFGRALSEYKQLNLPEESLLLKGTAWIAGFPINNHHVTFEQEGGKAGGEDFIGPSIDTGFRIAKVATPQKLVVSVDLATLLLAGDDPLPLYFEGTQTFKGVLGGRPYPIIWHKVDGDHSVLHAAELKLMGNSPKREELETYCVEYLRSCEGTWLIRPYFKTTDDPIFCEKPRWHELVMETARKVDRRNMATGGQPKKGRATRKSAKPKR
jgi:hypothetical protein